MDVEDTPSPLCLDRNRSPVKQMGNTMNNGVFNERLKYERRDKAIFADVLNFLDDLQPRTISDLLDLEEVKRHGDLLLEPD